MTMILSLSSPKIGASGLNLTRTEIDGMYGYTDEREEIAIAPIYQEAYPFVDGLALVSRDANGDGWPYEYGFIDSDGTEVIPLIYKYLSPFSEGLALAQYGSKYGYIDTTGKVVIDFIYDQAAPFENGQAVVRAGGETSILKNPNYTNPNLVLLSEQYKGLTTPQDCVDYLATAFLDFNERELNHSSLEELDKFFLHVKSTFPQVEGVVEGDTVYIKGENYITVVTQGENIKEQFLRILRNYILSEDVALSLLLIGEGLGNLTTEGEPASLVPETSYRITSFPVPHFDATVYNTFSKPKEYQDYLTTQLSQMEGTTNPNGLASLESFLSAFFTSLDPLHITARFNKLTLGETSHQNYLSTLNTLTLQTKDTLQTYGFETEYLFTNTALFLVDSIDTSQDFSLTISSQNITSYLEGVDGIRIVIGNGGEGLYFPTASLKTLLGNNQTLSMALKFSDTQITLSLFDQDGKTVLSQISAPIYLTLPVSTQPATVMAYLGENFSRTSIPEEAFLTWGGLIESNQTITFATSYTGVYHVIASDPILLDITPLSQESQAHILTMASNDFLLLDQGRFLPNDPLTRSQLISALVKLSFLQDPTASSSFSDLPQDHWAYPYISAGIPAGLTQSYQDNTFRGDNDVTREEVITQISTLLIEHYGYQYPENLEEILTSLPDNSQVTSWAKASVALGIQLKLVSTQEPFRGEELVTREEATQWLSLLFALIHSAPVPTASQLAQISQNTWTNVI